MRRTPYKELFGRDRPATVRAERALKQCLHCQSWFSIPQCHADNHVCCSAECGRARKAKQKADKAKVRERRCEVCGSAFVPRQWQLSVGAGRYCGNACLRSVSAIHLNAPQAQERAREGYWRARAENRVMFYSGPDNVRWRGGRAESVRRRIESGAANDSTRRYRAANPERVREFSRRRKGRKTGRLPRGTVATIFKNQRGRCAVCRTKLGSSYHTDHIMPLAKGGEHAALNIQLLCATCNVRKSAKDPIKFMQERGFLL